VADETVMHFYPYNHENVVLRDGDLVVLRNRMGALCGYCAFAPDEVPKEWHANYDADALQYLAIHGGLTYGEVHGNNDEERYAASRAASAAAPSAPETASLEDRLAAMSARSAAQKAARLSVPYTHVVFGFDCGHHGDDERPELSDPQFVLGLARQMREQLQAFAKIVPQWRSSLRETRIGMVDEICKLADTPTGLGFGAMIGLLGGASAFGPDAEGEPS
jgi:hypothetical protein